MKENTLQINKEDISKLVNAVIEEEHSSPIGFFSDNNLKHEYTYLENSKARFIINLADIINTIKPEKKRILEIGPYFGILSVCLSRLGYDVYVLDIPEFISNKKLQRRFEANNVKFIPFNLKNNNFPYDNNFFDLIVMCEVLEHLNFNPLPMIKELNRILKDNSFVYLSLPNIASYKNRKSLLLGNSIHNPIEDFFKQLETNSMMIVDLHWREYSKKELIELFNKSGFMITKHYFLGSTDVYINYKNPRFILKKIFYSIFQSLKGTQICIFKKNTKFSIELVFNSSNY